MVIEFDPVQKKRPRLKNESRPGCSSASIELSVRSHAINSMMVPNKRYFVASVKKFFLRDNTTLLKATPANHAGLTLTSRSNG